jgi:hypothetical protein
MILRVGVHPYSKSMERLFNSVVGSPPGATIQSASTPALMMLRSQHQDDAALVKAIIDRFHVDDESSSVQTLTFLVNLAVEQRIPSKNVDDVLQAVIEYGLHHTQWPETLRWICAFVHYHCSDVLTIAQLTDYNAIDVGAAALASFVQKEEVVWAAVVMLEHFTCCTFKPHALSALRSAIEHHPNNAKITRAAVATVTNATTLWGSGSDPVPLIDAFVGPEGTGLAALMTLMETGSLSDTPANIQLCLRALANLAAFKRESARTAVIDSVLGLMAANPTEDDLISYGLIYIANGSTHMDMQTPRVLDAVLGLIGPALARAEKGSTRILTDTIHTLGGLATHWKDSKSRMATAGVVNHILEIMRKYTKDSTLQQQCCNLLSYLSFDSEHITNTVTKSGGVALVLQAMRASRDNEPLLTAACAAVSGLTFNNPAGQSVIKDENAVPLLLDILKTAKRPRLVEMACLALGTLCWNVELKSAIAEAQGIDLVVSALNKYATSSGVVKNACRALAQIAFNSERYRDEMTQRGAIRLIVQGMSLHPQHDRAQLHACAALSYLSWTSTTNAAEILQHDGYRAIIRAMAHNLPNHEVQEHACRALANISGVPQADADAALQAIVDAMNRHERIPEVQEEACRAIVTLALAAPENKSKLHERNVGLAVVGAMRRFPNVQLVQQEAANAIAHLAYEHHDLNKTITELEAVNLIINAMRTYPSNSKLQLNSCGGLSALAFNNPIAQRQVFDLGGVPFILRAMKDFDRVRILELGCSLLGTLAWNSQIKEKVAEACVPTIIHTMREHPDNACLQKATIRAAGQFAFDSERNRVLLYEANAVELIIKALNEHVQNSKLVSHALVALTYLCWENGDIANAIMNSDCLDVVDRVMQVHSGCDSVARRAQHLRRILLRRNTPTGAECDPFPSASPVLPYNPRGHGFANSISMSPPTSPMGNRDAPRGGRAPRRFQDAGVHSPLFNQSATGFSQSLPMRGGRGYNFNASSSQETPRGGRGGRAGRGNGGPTNGRGGRFNGSQSAEFSSPRGGRKVPAQ